MGDLPFMRVRSHVSEKYSRLVEVKNVYGGLFIFPVRGTYSPLSPNTRGGDGYNVFKWEDGGEYESRRTVHPQSKGQSV